MPIRSALQALEMQTLHAVARIALRSVASPIKAKRIVDGIGRRLRPIVDHQAARKAAGQLRRGTCLSRSITLAARIPNARVAIGVDVGDGPFAHAWVELDGQPLVTGDAYGHVMARLL